MRFYEAITLLLIVVLPFFPVQIDNRIGYIIGAYAIFLLPLFVRNVKEDLAQKNLTTIFFILFLAAGLFSTVFSVDQKRSVFQLMLFVSYFIIFTSIRSVFRDFKSKERFALVLVLVTFCLSLIALYNTVILHYVNRASEGVSFMWVYYGHNHLSALLIFSLPVSFYFLIKFFGDHIKKILFFLVCSLLTISMYFTFSRGSIFALVQAVLLSIIVFNIASVKKFFAILIVSLTSLLLILVSFKNIGSFYGVSRGIGDTSLRDIYFERSIINFQTNPLFGTGLDTTRFAKYPFINRKILRSDYAHNFFLQMASDAGIFGFLSSVGLISTILWRSYKRVLAKIKTKEVYLLLAFWTGMLSSTLNTLIDFDWQLPTVFLLFWIIAGFLST